MSFGQEFLVQNTIKSKSPQMVWGDLEGFIEHKFKFFVMQVLGHHIYEYQKGLRHLVLHTMKSEDREFAERKLGHYNVDYIIVPVTQTKINIFFGRKECVDVVRTFCDKPLNELSAEQDFILGIMLGYDRLAQCGRFLSRKPLDALKAADSTAFRGENYSEIGIA